MVAGMRWGSCGFVWIDAGRGRQHKRSIEKHLAQIAMGIYTSLANGLSAIPGH
jgi:hypothetical protein